LDYVRIEDPSSVLTESKIPNVPKVEVGQTCQSIESIWIVLHITETNSERWKCASQSAT